MFELYEDHTVTLNNQLFSAAMRGDSASVFNAIDEGADINVVRTDKTPLWTAIDHQHYALAFQLIERGADCNCKNRFGWSALHMAATAGHLELVKVLSDNAAYVNRTDKTGETPLISAVKAGHPDVVAELLSRGADVRCRDDDGNTPLHYAAQVGNEAIVRALLNKGSISIPNRDGKSPADLGRDNVAAAIIEQYELSKSAAAGIEAAKVDESLLLSSDDIASAEPSEPVEPAPRKRIMKV